MRYDEVVVALHPLATFDTERTFRIDTSGAMF